MDRPVRRTRQRVPPTGLVGLLPQEEAAINRALHESLLDERKKTGGGGYRQRQEAAYASSSLLHHSLLSDPGPSSSFLHRDAQTELEIFSSDSSNKPSTSAKITTKDQRLHSPISPTHSFDSLFNDRKSSSPVYGNDNGGRPPAGHRCSSSSLSSPPSVESSLKLILSPASWSRSSSPCWSPTPETNTSKTPEKSSSKFKKTSPSKLKSVEEKPQKRKRGRPRKYPPKETKLSKTTPLKFGKGGKTQNVSPGNSHSNTVPKTYTKASLQFHRAKITKRKQQRSTGRRGGRGGGRGRGGRGRGIGGGGGGSHGMFRPLSPEAAVVLHDHCYMDQGFAEEAKSSPSTSTNSPLIRSSPYSVQRKFAHNQVPNATPTRPAKQEVESVARIKDIPKTEDFITFLCLRGSDSIPKHLEKFAFPWTLLQRRKSKTGQEIYLRPFPSSKGTNGRQSSKNVARKLGVSLASSPSTSAMQ